MADDAETDTDFGVVHRRLHPAVADHHHLGSDAFDPDLGVSAPESGGPLQGGAADILQGESREGGVDGHNADSISVGN